MRCEPRADAMTVRAPLILISLLVAALAAGCERSPRAPLPLAGPVDLARFMGDWYVIASTPTFIDKTAHNAVESYRLDRDGSIETTFTFRDNGFDGPEKRYTPRGFVRDRASNAVWGMRFLWPIEADYRIAYLSPDYSRTVIAREQRDYVWIMARTPEIPEHEYLQLVRFVAAQGYDPAQLRRVPQRWMP
jgi:apolipoprotein D and lipocalin family protein